MIGNFPHPNFKAKLYLLPVKIEMKVSINHKIENIYREIGEFGPYQLVVILLIGFVSSIPVFAGFSFSFYGAVPNHRLYLIFFNLIH